MNLKSISEGIDSPMSNRNDLCRRYTKFIGLLVIVLSISCVNNKNPVGPKGNASSYFAIYFLQDSDLKMKDIYNMDIDELQLAKTPWISDTDIRFYDWSSHCLYLKKDKSYFFPEWRNNIFNEFPLEWSDKPFVVVAMGHKRCYVGYFSSKLSRYWIAPEISHGTNSFYPSDVLLIDWIWLYHDSPQNNSDIKDALTGAGYYHDGLRVTFDTTDTILNIDNGDTSSISYTFTVTNYDTDDLLVIDPDKTGDELFHRYTNGPVFKNLETGELFESRWKKTPAEPSVDYWTPGWFTKLKSGQSIQRTVKLKGYPYFPTGTYLFQFMYDGPINIEKGIRERTDSRYWLGPTRSNILAMDWVAENGLSQNNSKRYGQNKIPKRVYQYIYY